MKVKVKTNLKTNGEIIEFENIGILLNNQLQYVENNIKVKIDFSNFEMIREDDDKKLVYKFIENEETVNKILVKNPQMTFDISIFTNQFKIKSNCCYIDYELVLEKINVLYKISWEVIK